MTTVTAPLTRRWWAWPVLLVSFPLSGLAASLLLGPVTTVPAAVVGGSLVGIVIGATSSLALRTRLPRWTAATALGLAVGTVASVLLPVAGPLVQGLALSATQAFARPPLHPAVWIPLMTATWTAGWAVSWVVATSDEPGFVVYGASGALLTTLVLLAVSVIARRSAR